MDDETRTLHLARQFAEIHIGDNDVLGRMARELLALIDARRPDVQALSRDGDCQHRIFHDGVCDDCGLVAVPATPATPRAPIETGPEGPVA